MYFEAQLLSTGTAFVVYSPTMKPYLITNRHNLTGRDQFTGQPLSKFGGVPSDIKINHNRKGALGQWIPHWEALCSNGTPRWIEHPTLRAQADFVALPLTNLTGVDLHAYEPANPGPDLLVGPADPVSVIGFPFGITAGGFFGVWATGFLASEPEIDFNRLPIVLVDCRSRPGQSGSPVIAYRAGGAVAMKSGASAISNGPVERFIGIYSGRINVESDLGMVWKATALAELISVL
jgi:hypothetical protein